MGFLVLFFCNNLMAEKNTQPPVVYLKSGKEMEGRIVASQPATVTIQTISGTKITILVEDLALKSQTNLPLSISAIYKDYANIKKSAESLIEMHEKSTNMLNKVVSVLQKNVEEKAEAASKAEKTAQGKPYEVIKTSSKVVERMSEYTRFSWQVQIKSNLDSPFTADIEITFSDNEGFKVHSDSLAHVKVLPDMTNKFSDTCFIKTSIFESIKHASVKLSQ
jgi:hypothetical protein